MTAAGVLARGREMRYLRGGRGPTVILLAPARQAQPLGDALLDRFRVIVPRLHRSALDRGGAPDDTAPDWLRDFMEGLGVGPSCFVSTPRHLAPLLRFASYDGDSVLGVVALPGPALRSPDAAVALAGLGALGLPLLVVEREHPARGDLGSTNLARLVSFLEGRRKE